MVHVVVLAATEAEVTDLVGYVPPVPSARDDQRDKQDNDADSTDDVRRNGNRTGHVARVCPDEADDRSDDEYCDHRSYPVEDASSADEFESTPVVATRQDRRWLKPDLALELAGATGIEPATSGFGDQRSAS
jgi:hypothetical protein